jgi:hypothetical protein
MTDTSDWDFVPADLTDSLPVDLGPIQARSDAATGTYYGLSQDDKEILVFWASSDTTPFTHLGELSSVIPQGDLDFLLHARTDMAALLAEVNRLKRIAADS